MSMKCTDCGNIFYEYEAGVEIEYHSEVPGGAYERFMLCPCCGSSAFEETTRCHKCKGEFLESELLGGYYCEECMKNVLNFENLVRFVTDSNLIDDFCEYLYDNEENSKSENAQSEYDEVYRKGWKDAHQYILRMLNAIDY